MSSKDQNSPSAAAKAIKKAWADQTFRSGLLKDANAALAGIGIDVPSGITIKVIADTPSVRHYVLPMPPPAELTDSHLETVVAGLTTTPKPHFGGAKGS